MDLRVRHGATATHAQKPHFMLTRILTPFHVERVTLSNLGRTVLQTDVPPPLSRPS